MKDKPTKIEKVWAMCSFKNWEKEAGDIKRNHVFKIVNVTHKSLRRMKDFEETGKPFRLYLRRGYTKVYSWKLPTDVTFWDDIVVVSW